MSLIIKALKTKLFLLSQILSLLFIISSSQIILAQGIVLQDNKLLVEFNSSTGALIKMEYKSSNWIIERRAELGVSFRLFVPLSDRRYNYILGQKQKLVKIEKISEHEIKLEWNNLISENGSILPIELTANVRLQEGALTFTAMLNNNSSSTVETIDYPYFGDFNPPARNSSLDVRTMWYGNLESNEIYPEFNNTKGYWGVFCPTKTFDSNRSLFCLIQAPKEGLYVEMHNPTQPYLLQYTFEQNPGVISSITNKVSPQDEISGKQNHLEFRTTHFIFTHPKSKIDLVPIVIQGYSGDWHSGVDLYKHWRTTWFQQPNVPDWIKEVNSWQQLQINSPEQDYRVPYTKLIKYAEECAQNGINAIQVVGWNHGGQDGDDPVQDTDPGLGTRQELKDAIAKIQSMGVKTILFGKLNWADKTTDLYKNELFKYAATDPYNIPYEQGGYSYYTPTQLAAINNRRRAVMDFLDPAYRKIAAKEFIKLLDFGASGWLFDENCHHGPVKYSFDANHGYTPPGFIYGGDIPMATQLRAEANKINPDFLFAGEGHQDWLMQYYPCSYFRITPSSTPVARYIDPKAPLVVAVTGFDDREMINLCLLDRYIIEYEPYNFKGFLSDFPLTLDYGKKVDLLRKKYKEYLWDADFRDTKGAVVTADGSIRYSVFITTSGKRAVVVVNQDINKSVTAKINLSASGLLKMATPEHPDSQPTTGVIQIPVRSAIVVMEQ
jgi:hypothetical protein